MATKATPQETLTKSRRKLTPKPEEGHAPQRWWQWFLIYPAFGVALVSAAPQWVDKAQSAMLGVASAAESKKQTKLWEKNQSCAGLPFKSFINPKTVAVDATICDSGDILVHAVTPQNAKIFKWVAVNDILPKRRGGLIPTAEAATLPLGLAGSAQWAPHPTLKLAQFQVNVLCQRMDGRYLHRRISTPQGCFHEVIDTYNGAVVSRNPAPCARQC